VTPADRCIQETDAERLPASPGLAEVLDEIIHRVRGGPVMLRPVRGDDGTARVWNHSMPLLFNTSRPAMPRWTPARGASSSTPHRWPCPGSSTQPMRR
jgi:hypothetical protein